jgi:hypothetical protein
MRYRVLFFIPFACIAGLALALLLVPAEQHALVFRVEVELAKTAAVVGSMVAALRFSRGDYLRTSWLLTAAGYFLLLLHDVLFRVGPLVGRSFTPLASGTVVLLANAFTVVGTIMIARVLRVAGFERTESRAVRWACLAGALLLGVGAAGFMAWTSLRELLDGQMASLVYLFSAVFDIITFALIAPFILTALALRGGSLSWTWALLTMSALGWLFFDAIESLAQAQLFAEARLQPWIECFRLLGCSFALVAGIAQRWAVHVERDA